MSEWPDERPRHDSPDPLASIVSVTADEARFIGLLEAAPDAIVGVDRDGRIVLANAETERTFGYRREELVGQPIEVLVPEVVRSMHAKHREEYLADPRRRPMG